MKCTKCGEDKSETEFYKGRSRNCKSCKNKTTRDWQKNNRERCNANAKKNRDKDLEKARKRDAEYRDKNREVVNESAKRYRERNREEVNLKALERHHKNPSYSIEWREKNKEKCKEYSRSWKDRNKEKTRLYKLNNKKKIFARTKVGNDLRDGKIVKPTYCSRCNGTGRIEAHHPDYDFPLNIVWLCKSCHHKEHEELKKAEVKNDQDKETRVSNGLIN
jgi:hypothetical protein